MLGKLTKFEFKATARTFLPLYVAAIVMTLLNKGFLYIQESRIFGDYGEGVIGKIIAVLGGFMMFTFVLFIVAIAFFTIFITVQRFYKNLFTDEGYLMHTLPATAKAHIGSKLIVSVVWTLATVIVILLSVFLLVINKDIWEQIKAFFENLPTYSVVFEASMNVGLYEFIGLFAGNIALTIPMGIMNFYLAIALGTVIMPKHRIGGAFLSYVIIQTVSQIVSSIALAVGALIMADSLTQMLSSPVPPDNFYYYIFGFSGLYAIISGIVGFFITSHIMTKKLNLE